MIKEINEEKYIFELYEVGFGRNDIIEKLRLPIYLIRGPIYIKLTHKIDKNQYRIKSIRYGKESISRK